MPHPPDTLYSSNALDVVAYKQEASADAKPLIVISFQPRGSLAAKEPWGAKFLLEAGYAVVGIQPKQNHWYQPLLRTDVVTAIRQAIDAYFPGDRPRLTYGSSMGGYAALRFAADLGATKVIALSPPAKIKVWALWQNDVKSEIDPVGPQSVPPDSHVLIAHDPMLTNPRFGPPDAIDANDFQATLSGRIRVELLECPHFGHPVTKGLSDRGLLKSIFLAFADETRVLRPDISGDTKLGPKELWTRVRNLVLTSQVSRAVELLLKNRELAASNNRVGRVALMALRKAGDSGPLTQELTRKFRSNVALGGAASAVRAEKRPAKKNRRAMAAPSHGEAQAANADKPLLPVRKDPAQMRLERQAKRKAARRTARINAKGGPKQP